MTSDLQQNRYDQVIRRVGGIIGPGSKVSEALSELFPVIDVERVPGELLLLGGTQLCMGATQATGAAGENARIQLFNPAGSGKLITVSSVIVTTPSTQRIRFATNNTAEATGIGTEIFRDRRLIATSRPVGQIRTGSLVAQVDAHGLIRILGNTPFYLNDENSIAVLPPNSGLEFGTTVFTTDVEVTFWWRERVALDSELNLP